MVALTETSQLIREGQALQVSLLRAFNAKLTVTEACEQVGISYKVYHDWTLKNTGYADTLRNFIAQTQQNLLSELEVAWVKGVTLLLEDFTSPNTKTTDRIALAKFLLDLKNSLEDSLHAKPGNEDTARDFLKQGPRLEKAKSRMASLEIEPTQDGGISVEISQYRDIIDATPK
jgi:hypothetical protein